MVYVCSACEAKSPVKDDIKHDAEKDKGKKVEIKKTCDKSGTAPHVPAK